MVVDVEALHIAVGHMDGRSWLLFALILAPALLLFVWTALKVQRDGHEVPPAHLALPPDDWRAGDDAL